MSSEDPSSPSDATMSPGAAPRPEAPPAVAPAGPPVPLAPPVATFAPPVQAPRKRRAWIWVLVVALVLLSIIGMCGWSAWLLAGSDSDGIALGGNGIAVIPLDGAIAGAGSAGAGIVTPEAFLKKLERAEDDPDVRAIVLRVDSPGGTVAASEEIAAYVRDAEKPVVVSAGDVDASGAYMVSSQADQIFAMPGTAVGSIGVITQIPNVNGLMDKAGIEFVTVTAGKYKGAGSPFRPLTPEETALIQGSVDEVYGQFIDIVAEGRDMERSEVASLATGWAWNGEQAKKLGLVDKIGTYSDALDAAADLGEIDGEYVVIHYDETDFNTLLSSFLGIEEQLSAINAAVRLPGSSGSVAVPK